MGGLNNFLVVALAALYGTSTTLANVALTGAAADERVWRAGRRRAGIAHHRHATVAALGLAFAGIFTALVGLIGFSSSRWC